VMDESRVETMNAAAQETVALYKALLDWGPIGHGRIQ
jgi:hypothetical protein